MLKLIYAGLLLLCSWAANAQGHCQRGDCRNGEGTLRFTDGALYRGNFTDGYFEGRGAIAYPDGSTYVGGFHRQLQEGKGTLTDGRGNRYEGNWRAGKRHGGGQLILADGSTLAGEWRRDTLHGEVNYRFANEDHYRGELLGYRLTGYGSMQYANGDRYYGNWLNDVPHGKGSMTYADGTTMSGNWQGGEFQPAWEQLGYRGDENAVVDCNEGCPDGPGRFIYADGTVFTGPLADGKPRGESTVHFPDGKVYYGNFSDHRPDGLGVMVYPDGHREGGIWRGGRLAKKMYADESTAAASPAYDEEVKVWAVVVGCAYYQHMKSLRYTDDDAYQVYAFLKSIEGGALSDQQVTVLVDENATRDNILAAMRDTYRRADENDLILFYFSGHGLPGAFLPIDYDGEQNALAHTDVHAALSQTRSRHKLVIADACHSGSLASRGVEDNRKVLTDYYAALTAADASTALMMSSKGEEISMEDGGLRSGVFSHYLIRGLKGEADDNRDLLVSVEELFRFVHRQVRLYTGNVQTPTLSGTYDATMPVSIIRAR